MSYELNIREVTYALTIALDFVGVDDNMHGKRVAYMAGELSQKMAWSKDFKDILIFTGMLHDCGVSSTDVHKHLVNELDWDNSQVHSIRGEQLLNTTDIYSQYALYVKYHHTHWDALPQELSDDEKKVANLIYLVDRVDAIKAHTPEIGNKATKIIIQTIQQHSGTLFSPELVDAFVEIAAKDSFWFYLEEEALDEYFMEWIETAESSTYSFKQVQEVALMFAAVVDAKSAFTAEHSISVALLSRFLAKSLDLNEASCEKIELSGLLHDLGKLKVDDDILNKPGKLNDEERLLMNRHGFDSNIILRHIKSFKEIARIASLHHETLDAKGYPYQLEASQIPIEARIIAVADIFQALVQNRPYREGLSMDSAFKIVNEMTNEGKLDSNIVQKLKENLQESYTLANSSNPLNIAFTSF